MLQETMRCIKEGEDIDGIIRSKNKLGRKVAIKPGSREDILIANWMEAHCGFRMTMAMVNENRREEGKDRVSRFSMMSSFY